MKLLLILIIILIILIVLSIFIENKENMLSDIDEHVLEISEKIYIGDKWNHYRLGDLYYYQLDLKGPATIEYHVKDYPGSIAEEYIKKNIPIKNENKELLLQIIKNRKNIKGKVNDNDLILHMRVGDVLNVTDTYHNNKYTKFGNIDWWNEIIDYIKKNNINRVFILSGLHIKRELIKSAQYIKNRTNFIKTNIPGIKIEYILGQSPDEDLIFCSECKHFISTGGGYGRLISEIMKK